MPKSRGPRSGGTFCLQLLLLATVPKLLALSAQYISTPHESESIVPIVDCPSIELVGGVFVCNPAAFKTGLVTSDCIVLSQSNLGATFAGALADRTARKANCTSVQTSELRTNEDLSFTTLVPSLRSKHIGILAIELGQENENGIVRKLCDFSGALFADQILFELHNVNKNSLIDLAHCLKKHDLRLFSRQENVDCNKSKHFHLSGISAGFVRVSSDFVKLPVARAPSTIQLQRYAYLQEIFRRTRNRKMYSYRSCNLGRSLNIWSLFRPVGWCPKKLVVTGWQKFRVSNVSDSRSICNLEGPSLESRKSCTVACELAQVPSYQRPSQSCFTRTSSIVSALNCDMSQRNHNSTIEAERRILVLDVESEQDWARLNFAACSGLGLASTSNYHGIGSLQSRFDQLILTTSLVGIDVVRKHSRRRLQRLLQVANETRSHYPPGNARGRRVERQSNHVKAFPMGSLSAWSKLAIDVISPHFDCLEVGGFELVNRDFVFDDNKNYGETAALTFVRSTWIGDVQENLTLQLVDDNDVVMVGHGSGIWNEQGGSILDNCQHVYLDVGGNIGVQTRKLFQPNLYMAKSKANSKRFEASIMATFKKHFGANATWWRDDVCVVGFEPNHHHWARLRELSERYTSRGWRTAYIFAAVSGKNGTAIFQERVSNTIEAGASLIDSAHQDFKKAREVHLYDFARFIERHVANRILPVGQTRGKVVAKIDVEGAEYSIFEELLSHVDDVIQIVDEYKVEWHGSSGERHKTIKEAAELAFGARLSSMDDEDYSIDPEPLPPKLKHLSDEVLQMDDAWARLNVATHGAFWRQQHSV
jgi:hypothetical protein